MHPSQDLHDLDQLLDAILIGLRKCERIPPSHDRQRDRSNATALPASARPYILTLHILYHHVLLDALDLLDRGLVFRLHVPDESYDTTTAQAIPPETSEKPLELDDAETAARSDGDNGPLERKSSRKAVKTTYHVQSAQILHQRHHSVAGSDEDDRHASIFYQVQLRAWHCSCPAFACEWLAAGPSPQVSLDSIRGIDVPQLSTESDPDGDGLSFHFGGIPSLRRMARSSGMSSQATQAPVCKHLMACALAEAAPSLFDCRTGPDLNEKISLTSASNKGMKGLVQKWVDTQEAAGWAVGAGIP